MMGETTTTLFSTWLRAELAARKWTNGSLARRLNVDVVTVRAWTKGVRTPASAQFSRLADVLGVPVAKIQELIIE